MKKVFGLLAVAGLATAAQAVVDGSKDAAYGPALAVQTVDTGFGNNQSELNAVYCYSDASNLNLLFTGNLETNFNKLHVFFDFAAGGSNNGSGLPFGGSSNNNLTFDAGFGADLMVQVNGGGGPTTWFVNAWDYVGANGDYLGSNDGSGAPLAGGGNNWLGLGLGVNNSNVAGVGGGTGAADQTAALAVTTGIEISIPLSYFGGNVNGIKALAYVNSSSNDFLSNQFLGGLPAGTGNLGGGADLSTFTGDQFFVIPAPGAVALMGMGGLLAARRRRA